MSDADLEGWGRRPVTGDEPARPSTSPTEYKLLHYLLSNPRRVLTRNQILEHLWTCTSEGNVSVLEIYNGSRARGGICRPDRDTRVTQQGQIDRDLAWFSGILSGPFHKGSRRLPRSPACAGLIYDI